MELTTLNTSTTASPLVTTRDLVIAEERHMQELEVMAGVLQDFCGSRGISIGEREAFAGARQFAEALKKFARRGTLYSPTLWKIERNAAIKAEFNGRNLREVMERWDVSRTTVYRICGTRCDEQAD